MWRRGAVALAVLGTVLVAPAASSASETATFYLGADGVPIGSLTTQVQGGVMPNLDMGRDVHPGLRLERSELGAGEALGTRFQQWQRDMDGGRLTGHPSVVIWAATAGFDPETAGSFTVFLLDCPPFGHRCSELGRASAEVARGAGDAWAEHVLALPRVDHQFGKDRHLAVKVVAEAGSEADLMIAYGYPSHRSRLTISDHSAPAEATDTGESAFSEAHRSHGAPQTRSAETDSAPDLPAPGPGLALILVNGALLGGLGLVLYGMLPARPRSGASGFSG